MSTPTPFPVEILIEKLNRPNYHAKYRAHIEGKGFDHHGEGLTPAKALVLAAIHGLSHEGAAQ